MSLRQKTVSGIFWTIGQQFSVQIINFVVQIILARLLLPEVFGLIAMIQIFITIGQTLMDSGMTSSLIRTPSPDQMDYSTVFFTNVFASIFIYILIFYLSPIVAKFYSQPQLENILRVLSLSFIIRSLVGVQTTKLTKEMNFKLQMLMQVPSTIIGAIVGILLALKGYGVWSLVWLNLTQSFVFMVQHWFYTNWRPSLKFDMLKLKDHFNFGSRLTLASLLDTIYNNSYTIVIGKQFSPALVGFYDQAQTLRLFPVTQITSALGNVTYPLFSIIQEDDEKLKEAYKKIMQIVLLIVLPIMLILIGISEPLFRFVLGKKWLPSVPMFRILCIASIVRPISGFNLNILKVKGRSDLFLKIEVVKKVLGVLILFISLHFGVMAMVWSLTISSILFLGINSIYSSRFINYGIFEQIKDVLPIFLYGLLSFAIMTIIDDFFLKTQISDVLRLSINVLIFLLPYSFACFFFRKDIILEVVNLIKK